VPEGECFGLLGVNGRGLSLAAHNRPRVYTPHLSCCKASLPPPKLPRESPRKPPKSSGINVNPKP
jgi:hypothetical protein